MHCPFCGHGETKVLETREIEGSAVKKRRRMCAKCEKKFTTYERVKVHPLLVVKRNGEREQFDREKLKSGILVACSKSSVGLDAIEKIIAEIEAELQEYLVEFPAVEIGKMVLLKLKKIDEVAYIRFASIYRKFDSIDTFLREIRRSEEHTSELQSH